MTGRDKRGRSRYSLIKEQNNTSKRGGEADGAVLGDAAEPAEEKIPTEEFLKEPPVWIINYSPIWGFIPFVGVDVEA